MSQALTLARPYARAAFRQAQTEGKLALWSDMLAFLATALSDAALLRALDDPRVPRERQLALVLEICGGHLSASGENFVRVLASAGRLPLAPAIRELFETLRAEAENTLRVELAAAYPVNAKYQQDLAAALNRRLGRAIEFSVRTDPALLAGVVIRAGDQVIDASLKGRLAALTQTLAA